MAKVTHLSHAQWCRAHAHFADWKERLYSGEWDEHAARDTVAWLYDNFLHKPTPRVLVMPNPLVTEIVINVLRKAGQINGDGAIRGTLWDTLGGTLEHTLGGTLEHTLGDTLGVTLGDTLGNTLGDTLWKIEMDFVPFARFGVFEGGYNCWMSYCELEGFTAAPLAREYFARMFQANFGFFVPFDGVAFICPPPKITSGKAEWPGWALPFKFVDSERFAISPYFSVGVHNNQVMAFVGDLPVTSCRYAIVTVAPDIAVDTMDDLILKYALSEQQSKRFAREAGLTLADEAFVHASNLQVWAEAGYDLRFIDSRLAWTLLRHLRVYDSRANDAFLQAVHERWERGNSKSREALQDIVPDAVAELAVAGIIDRKR